MGDRLCDRVRDGLRPRHFGGLGACGGGGAPGGIIVAAGEPGLEHVFECACLPFEELEPVLGDEDAAPLAAEGAAREPAGPWVRACDLSCQRPG